MTIRVTRQRLKGSFRDLMNKYKDGTEGFTLDEFEYDKGRDIKRVETYNLPYQESFICSYRDFNIDNKQLT